MAGSPLKRARREANKPGPADVDELVAERKKLRDARELEKVGVQLAVTKPCGSAEFLHPTLIANGYCRSGSEKDNIVRYGYESIRAHYIEGPGDLPDSALAALWEVNASTLMRWKDAGRWEEFRQRRLDSLPVLQGGNKADELVASMRQNFREMALESITEAIDLTRKRLRNETEQKQSASGEVATINKSASSHKAETNALTDLITHGYTALGMQTKFTGQFAGAQFTANIFEIKRPSEAQVADYLADTLAEFEGDIIEAQTEPDFPED